MRNPSRDVDRLAELLGDRTPIAHGGGQVVHAAHGARLPRGDDPQRTRVALEPVRLVIVGAVADHDVERGRADGGLGLGDGGLQLADGEIEPRRWRRRDVGEHRRSHGRGLWQGGERLGRDVGRLAADAELVADDERDPGAEGEENCERDPDEHRSSGVRLHAEQRNKSGSDVPVNSSRSPGGSACGPRRRPAA